MSLTAKVGAFWFDKSLTQVSLAKKEGVSIVYSVAPARGWLRPKSARTPGLNLARISSLTVGSLSGDRVPGLRWHSFAIRKGLRPIPPSLVSRSKFPGKGSDWPSLYRIPIPGSGGGIHGPGTEKTAVSVPILWLEAQQDILTRSWRVGAVWITQNKSCPPTSLCAWPSLPSHHTSQWTLLASSSINSFSHVPKSIKALSSHLPQVQTQMPSI